jgi:archaellum component FlaG (FlaF/FlaG flagellin family)
MNGLEKIAGAGLGIILTASSAGCRPESTVSLDEALRHQCELGAENAEESIILTPGQDVFIGRDKLTIDSTGVAVIGEGESGIKITDGNTVEIQSIYLRETDNFAVGVRSLPDGKTGIWATLNCKDRDGTPPKPSFNDGRGFHPSQTKPSVIAYKGFGTGR